MSFSINLTNSGDLFKTVCNQLSHFGEEGHERIQIAKAQTGDIPFATFSPSRIERVLRFFGFKKSCFRLNEVSNFSLNWLRAHALKYNEEFHSQIPQIQKLRPLMVKAQLGQDFDELISSVETARINHISVQAYEKTSAELEKKYEEKGKILEQKVAERLVDIQLVYENTQQLHQALKQRVAFSKRELNLADFQFHWPQNFQKPDQFESVITAILSRFLFHPGTTIQRLKKTKTIILNVPVLGQTVYELPIKADFYLEGSVSQRRIIIKTPEKIGSGGERKVMRAFDLLSGEELVSKPFTSNPREKQVIQYIHENQLPGFVPFIEVRNNRFYEKRCLPLDSYFSASAPLRFKLIHQLLSAVKTLHGLHISLSYSFEDRYSRIMTTRNLDKVAVFHADIKPANILVFTDSKNNHNACLSDFGSVCAVASNGYTKFFRSPERTAFIENEVYKLGEVSRLITTDHIVEHNLTFGQSNDVWSLGLVLLTLLCGGRTLPSYKRAIGIPDLKCFSQGVEKYNQEQHHQDQRTKIPQNTKKRIPPPDSWIKDLKQQDIDSSIMQLKNECPEPIFEQVWPLVQKMLLIDVNKRFKLSQLTLL